MSFYGSIYYQAGEAIAKILIENIGKQNVGFYDETLLEDIVEISANGRKGTFSLGRGNRWIQLATNKEENICSIYHNKPDEKNVSTSILPFDKTENPGVGAEITELSLSDEVYLQIPIIYYDEAGHLVPTSNVKYFRIPKIQIQASIDDLALAVDALEESVNAVDERLQEAENLNESQKASISTLQSIVGVRGNLTSSSSVNITSAIGNIDKLREDIGNNSATLSGLITDIYSKIDTMANGYVNLDTDIRNLKQAIEEIKDRLDAANL